MKKIFIILLFLFAIQNLLFAQNNLDSSFKVVLTSSASPVFSYFENERYSSSSGNLKYGFGFFLRGMWYPSRLLSIGLMTGYMHISNDNLIDTILPTATARLSAIPLQAVVAMQKNNWEFALGIGPYLMMSKIDNGSIAHGERLELGLTVMGSYSFLVSNRLFITPEFRAVYFSFREILSLMPTISFKYYLYEYVM